MKKYTARGISVLLIAALLLSLAGCGAGREIKATIGSFQKACNELNVAAAVDCIDPAVAGVLKLGADLLGAFTGENTEEVFARISSLLGDGAQALDLNSFKTLKIKVKDIAANELSADAKVLLEYTGNAGEAKASDATISLKNTDEGWKISGVKFM